MNYVEARQTAQRLFGDVKLHRTKNHGKCLVLRKRKTQRKMSTPDGEKIVHGEEYVPIGDGKSWLEALRSAGTFVMAENKKREIEMEALKARLEEFQKATGWDPERLDEEQLGYFDVWMACKDKGEEPPPAPAPKSLIIRPGEDR